MEVDQQFHIVLLSTKVNILSLSLTKPKIKRTKQNRNKMKWNRIVVNGTEWKRNTNCALWVPSINVTFFSLHLFFLLTISDNLFLIPLQAQIARRTWMSACQIHVKMAAYVETVTMATPAPASQAIWGIIASWMWPSVTRVSRGESRASRERR